ncbi:MAG: hypothetical protein IIA60_14535 [Candidatus Marinimicrobia bacterium]|nr:hypothetical protein [Candidatus Neomarinimicrobiota bacterium]
MQKTLYFPLFLSIAFILAGCEEPPDEPEPCLPVAGDVLLPIAEGNYWTSEQINWGDGQIEEGFEDTGKVVIEKMMTIQFEGTEYQVGVRNVHFPVDLKSDLNWLFWNGPDGLYFMGGVSSFDSLTTKVLQLKYPVEVGESWMVPRMVYDGTFRVADTVAYVCVDTDAPYETPLGTFQCVVYSYSIKPAEDVLDLWHYFAYYAPGVGRVGTLIYSSPEAAYPYHSRDIFDLSWETILFDYCLK